MDLRDGVSDATGGSHPQTTANASRSKESARMEIYMPPHGSKGSIIGQCTQRELWGLIGLDATNNDSTSQLSQLLELRDQ